MVKIEEKEGNVLKRALEIWCGSPASMKYPWCPCGVITLQKPREITSFLKIGNILIKMDLVNGSKVP